MRASSEGTLAIVEIQVTLEPRISLGERMTVSELHGLGPVAGVQDVALTQSERESEADPHLPGPAGVALLAAVSVQAAAVQWEGVAAFCAVEVDHVASGGRHAPQIVRMAVGEEFRAAKCKMR